MTWAQRLGRRFRRAVLACRLLFTDYHLGVTLSVVVITFNEEANLPRTLESVKWADEIVVVDSGSTDRTVEIARSYGAKVFIEPWKGFAAQKNSALEKATGDWILSLDADEAVSGGLAAAIQRIMDADEDEVRSISGLFVARKNFFLGEWIRHGGFYPDRKLRLFRKSAGLFENRLVHEDIKVQGKTAALDHFFEERDINLVHHAYPTLSSYIEHMDRYSSLGAQMAVEKGRSGFSFLDLVVRPMLTFIYNYFFRFGFLDGREGLLLHLYHSVYVSWKYAKVWELTRRRSQSTSLAD